MIWLVGLNGPPGANEVPLPSAAVFHPVKTAPFLDIVPIVARVTPPPTALSVTYGTEGEPEPVLASNFTVKRL